MKIKIVIFVLLIGIVSCTSEVDDSCSKDAENLQNLQKWWNEDLSLKKPLKCRAPNFVLSDVNDYSAKELMSLFHDRVPIVSYPCKTLTDEWSIKFKYSGKIEAGTLTGPGRLFLAGNGIQDSNEACLKVRRVLVRHNLQGALIAAFSIAIKLMLSAPRSALKHKQCLN